MNARDFRTMTLRKRQEAGRAGLLGIAAVAGFAVTAWKLTLRQINPDSRWPAATGSNNKPPHPKNGATPTKHWGMSVAEIEDIAARGQEIYHKNADWLEAKHPHQCVVINVDTGDVLVGDTFRDTHNRYRARFGDAPSWDARVGDAGRDLGRTRLVQ